MFGRWQEKLERRNDVYYYGNDVIDNVKEICSDFFVKKDNRAVKY